MNANSIIVLTESQKKLLAGIVNDKYAIGAYSGMIYNALLAHPDLTIDELIQKSLEVKERIRELGGTTTYVNEVVEENIGGQTISINKFKKVIK